MSGLCLQRALLFSAVLATSALQADDELIGPPPQEYKSRVDGEIGLNISTGNSPNREIRLAGSYEQEDALRRYEHKASFYREQAATSGEPMTLSEEKAYWKSRGEWYFVDQPGYLFAKLAFEYDRFSYLQRSATASSGLGYSVVRSKPLRFDLERLMRYPMVSRIHFMECAGNSAANALSPTPLDQTLGDLAGEVSCSEWTGVPLSYLLNEAGLKDSAKWVVVEGADGGSHSRSLPLSNLLKDGMIALYQNGERLRPSQGYPLRLFMPGWEGNVNVKWVHRLEVVDAPAYTKDESGMYTQILSDGQIERFAFHMDVKSLITHPSGLQRLPETKGFYEIAGLAWSGHGRISRVDVSVDGGTTWAAAQLHGPVLDRAFTRFTMPWQWNGKKATLMSRATDERGRTQPLRSEWKRKYAMHSFHHYNAIQVWRVGSDGLVENSYA